MIGAARFLAVVSMLAGACLAAPALAQSGQDLDDVLAAIERERQALIELGELDPTARETDECDRWCLDALGKSYLDSLASGDFSGLPLARNTIVTENGARIAPGDGYWRRAGALRLHRLNILDPVAEVAAGMAVMDNALVAYRLKMAFGALVEVETFVVEPDDDGATLSRETLARRTLTEPRAAFLRRIAPEEQNSRTQLGLLAGNYPAANDGAPETPIAATAERVENGVLVAGPDCDADGDCAWVSPPRADLRHRVLALDEQQGIALIWLDWTRSGQTHQVYEALKIHGGHVHAAEAFTQPGDPETYPGWPLD